MRFVEDESSAMHAGVDVSVSRLSDLVDSTFGRLTDDRTDGICSCVQSSPFHSQLSTKNVPNSGGRAKKASHL